jgi:hypothetical protein
MARSTSQWRYELPRTKLPIRHVVYLYKLLAQGASLSEGSVFCVAVVFVVHSISFKMGMCKYMICPPVLSDFGLTNLGTLNTVYNVSLALFAAIGGFVSG